METKEIVKRVGAGGMVVIHVAALYPAFLDASHFCGAEVPGLHYGLPCPGPAPEQPRLKDVLLFQSSNTTSVTLSSGVTVSSGISQF
jgi:hypothetical protein